MKLVIVESPTKAKTISNFLDKEYKVESSYGHVRDLPKSKLGIDVENNFEPSYVIPTKARKKVNELKKLAEKADEVILASDEDREGEAIAWHVSQLLGAQNAKRIVFHEITKAAIEEAVKNPRELDMNLVDAQQARRVLDRLVGYELSPFLWKKLFKGLSAGRVQSVAVRLIVDREREIQTFIPQEYWSIEAELAKNSNVFTAKLHKKDGKILDKLEIKNKEEADTILKELNGANYIVDNVEKKEAKRQPLPPFTTSTLQQDAANKLRYSAKQTMMIAQQLYENGHISYMRTDSVNLSRESLAAAKKFIGENFGKQYCLEAPRVFKGKSKGAQEAHEAIRPTSPAKTPDTLKEKLDAKQHKLYDLIWRRFIACQMPPAVFDQTAADITAKNYVFRASGSILKFDGWLKVYPLKFSENILPELSEKEKLDLVKILPEQHFTEPPPRYNEASLIKALEDHGIGRPSTYAPTITTIQTRNYVAKNEQKRLAPTETGIMVNDILVKHFPEIVDVQFTAKMEEDLDKIAEGEEKWVPVIKNFYGPFHENLLKKEKEVAKQEVEETTDEVCANCGKPMLVKRGRFGKFLACSGFPECKTTKPMKKDAPKQIGMKCPKCKETLSDEEAGDIVMKRTKKGRVFYGCSRYPKCDFASWKNPLENEGK
ncbi:MAG: type I DNA topoisomerase [Candidatus Pacebacteria bacterium]|nr:type I DNA topoisomerase [Candidatus Paceibacterota bacterium]NUQ57275.1 type I DNA topoisomerase [Candidatus Paceibacter sp.]